MLVGHFLSFFLAGCDDNNPNMGLYVDDIFFAEI